MPLEVPDRTVYYVARAGEIVAVPREDVDELPPDRSRFVNVLSMESLERIRRLVDFVSSGLVEPLPTKALIERVGVGADEKGAVAALRVLDLEGLVHVVSGRGRQLVWHPGERPKGVSVPKMVERGKFEFMAYTLQRLAPEWAPTDFFVRVLDPDVLPDFIDDDGRYEPSRVPRPMKGLPVFFFGDYSKSARKYLLGALKAWFWLESVAWRHYTSQAVEWSWVGPIALPKRAPRRPIKAARRVPYDVTFSPAEERILDYLDAYQRWVDTHHPDEAQKYHDRRRVRSLQREREAKERERALRKSES